MDNTALKDIISKEVSKAAVTKSKSARRRSPTLLKLQWLAERARKAEKIKAALSAGEYQVDSADIARAMLGLDKE